MNKIIDSLFHFNMSRKSKDHAYSHSENQTKICLLCQKKKNGMKIIGDAMKKLIQSCSAEYDPNDVRLPVVICSSCRIHVYKLSKGKIEATISFANYLDFTLPPKSTRFNSSQLCCCTLCEIARKDAIKMNGNITKKKLNESVKKLCVKCFSEISKGKSHICSSSKQIVNIKNNIHGVLNSKSQEHLVASMIKENQSEKGTSSKISLAQEHGKPLTIVLSENTKSSETKKSHCVSASDVLNIQNSFDLSTRTMLGITTAFRVATKKRNFFESGLQNKLTESNHVLDSFFEIKEGQFRYEKSNESTVETKKFIFCKNIENLCNYVSQKRNAEAAHMKIGMDGGGGFFKICLSLQDADDSCEVSTDKSRQVQSYADGVAAKKFKTSGVKKLFILGLVGEL